jgi:hypothetical protein
MKRNLMRRALAAFPVLLLAVSLNADTLVLRDGRRIQGQLISVQNGIVEFAEARPFGPGYLLRFNQNEISGIDFDRYAGNPSSSPQHQPQGPRGGRASGLRERQVMVGAQVPWTDTNIDVQSGQEIYFEPAGEVNWGPGRRNGPAGELSNERNPNRPIPNRPAAALIGRVGQNSTDYFFIGANRGPYKIRSSGRLLLGTNDDFLQDNSGAFRVVVHY